MYEDEFNTLLPGLTEKQVAFLLRRRDEEEDTPVLEEIGPSRHTLINWKNKSADFKRAYFLATDRSYKKMELISLNEEQRNVARSEAFDIALAGLGPGLHRLITTAASAVKDADATAAFKVLSSILRLEEVGLNSMTKNNQAMMSTLQALAPQYLAQLKKKGIDLRELGISDTTTITVIPQVMEDDE
jgi:hypothetical protein